MKIYIQYEGKFFGFDGSMWDKLKLYNVDTFEFDSPCTLDFKPQFVPGDRVHFEDLKYWTEVIEYDNDGCRKCVRIDLKCNIQVCRRVIFQKLEETTEREKAPDPQPTAILDNERNRMAWELYKIYRVAIHNKTGYECMDVAYCDADAFIARVKQEDK